MNRNSRNLLLDEQIRLLVTHFGVASVRAALEKACARAPIPTEEPTRNRSIGSDRQASPTVTSMLERLRKNDEEKYRLIADFYGQLKQNLVLPEAQDIRHFAQLIGLKEIKGKSRKDLVPFLMRFLLEHPTNWLEADLVAAKGISEKQRQLGFSVITDKLMGKKQANGAEAVSD